VLLILVFVLTTAAIGLDLHVLNFGWMFVLDLLLLGLVGVDGA
jgi:hypothetical protein